MVVAGGDLDRWADQADKHPPVLHNRDRFGRDEQWIEHHPAYHEMERIGFHEFGLHAAPHRPILGWPTGVSPLVKFTLHYLFSQAEFGLMCPLAVTELANSGRLSLDGLITHHQAPSQAHAAYATAFGDDLCLKMILDWRNFA